MIVTIDSLKNISSIWSHQEKSVDFFIVLFCQEHIEFGFFWYPFGKCENVVQVGVIFLNFLIKKIEDFLLKNYIFKKCKLHCMCVYININNYIPIYSPLLC